MRQLNRAKRTKEQNKWNKHNAKWLQLFFIHCSLFISVALTACSDWDDHYDAGTQQLDSQKASIWENISTNPNLKEFTQLLSQTGYDKVLNAPQSYTVWAPADGTFDFETLKAQGNEKLMREFVQNHIARSLYPASGSLNERVMMLNDKKMTFAGNGSYTMQNIALGQTNQACGNGTLHILSGKIPYLPNIYESLNADTYPIDSISQLYHKYDIKVLNELKSIPGPMVDGEITYLDSIMEEDNDLYDFYNSYINREDSNYTMLMPSNEAWRKAKEAISPYYNYLPTFQNNDSVAATTKGRIANVQINSSYLHDSLVQVNLLRDLFFNNNIYDNTKLNSLQTGQQLQCDSLYGTTLSKFFGDDAAELFNGAQRLENSNGAVWLTDSLRMKPWISWCPEIVQEAELSSMLAGTFNGTPNLNSVTFISQNPAVPGHVSNGRYVEIEPSSSSSNPEVAFYLRGVRSATYVVYVVTVPAHISNVNRVNKPNRLMFTMCYADEAGKLKETRMTNPVEGGNYFTTDTSRVDTLCLGEFTFPVSYVGLGTSTQKIYPYLRIRSQVSNSMASDYDRYMRFDCIILRPKSLDDYLKANPDYKYDH